MPTPLLLLTMGLCGVARGQAGADAAGLREVGRIELPGLEGRTDYMAVDAEGRRLCVAAPHRGEQRAELRVLEAVP
jgi:hypothetical protein